MGHIFAKIELNNPCKQKLAALRVNAFADTEVVHGTTAEDLYSNGLMGEVTWHKFDALRLPPLQNNTFAPIRKSAIM